MARVKYIDPDPQEFFQKYLEEKNFTVKEAARILRMAPATLQKKRINKTGPKYIKTGYRSVIYPAKDLIKFMKERHYFSTSEDLTLLPQQKVEYGDQSSLPQLSETTAYNLN